MCLRDIGFWQMYGCFPWRFKFLKSIACTIFEVLILLYYWRKRVNLILINLIIFHVLSDVDSNTWSVSWKLWSMSTDLRESHSSAFCRSTWPHEWHSTALLCPTQVSLSRLPPPTSDMHCQLWDGQVKLPAIGHTQFRYGTLRLSELLNDRNFYQPWLMLNLRDDSRSYCYCHHYDYRLPHHSSPSLSASSHSFT